MLKPIYKVSFKFEYAIRCVESDGNVSECLRKADLPLHSRWKEVAVNDSNDIIGEEKYDHLPVHKSVDGAAPSSE